MAVRFRQHATATFYSAHCTVIDWRSSDVLRADSRFLLVSEVENRPLLAAGPLFFESNDRGLTCICFLGFPKPVGRCLVQPCTIK